MKPLYESEEWDFEALKRVWDVIDDIGSNHYGLDYYPAQVEIISADQMLEAYCSHAMPIMYSHWSFGKEYLKLRQSYNHGIANLAYEVVINTDPCIAYLMESNSMTMQTLVLAHAAVGHNSYFKTNYMFREHTNSKSILDYLRFAKAYVEECDKKYGSEVVGKLLDKFHSFMYQSIDRYPRKHMSKAKRKEKLEARLKGYESSYEPVIDSLLAQHKHPDKRKNVAHLPEDNILYFIEKHSLVLEPWQRELARIVRKISQYFYPQILNKVSNEGFATFWHYTIMNKLAEDGYITPGQKMEFLLSHTNIVGQRAYSPLNPYSLGYEIYTDIKRICQAPTKEDLEYFPHLNGQNWIEVCKDMAANYRDESLVANFLTPRVVQKLKYFSLSEHESKDDHYVVKAIHDTEDFVELRRTLSRCYEWDRYFPTLTIVSHKVGLKPRIKVKLEKDLTTSASEQGQANSILLFETLAELLGCEVWAC